MRVTQTMLTNQALAAIHDGQTRMAKSQNQLATGRRIQTPSDDPAGHASATRLSATVAATEQFKRQAGTAQEYLEATDNVLSGLSDVLAHVHELAVQGANGTLGANDRSAMAVEVNQLLEETVSLANSSENGRYLLGGRETLTTPLTVTRNGAGDITAATWNPRGVDGTIDIDVAQGVSVQANVGGTTVLGADTDPTFLPALLVQLRDALATNNQGAVNGLIDTFTAAQTRLSQARAAAGSQLSAVGRAKGNLDTTEVATKSALSAVLDADVARLAVELSQQQSVYQAALSAAARAIQPSLLEFLR